MSKNIDSFCSNLRVRLNTVDSRLKTAIANLETLPTRTEESLNNTLNELQTKMQLEKTRFKTFQSSLLTRAENFVEESKESILEWKSNRDSLSLQKRAERKEKLAMDIIEQAIAMVDNAELAIVEAAIAHADASQNAADHHMLAR